MEKTTKSSRTFKIAITGPESTGKSTLAEQLAAYYKTVWVPEYAREYIASIKRPYNYRDILHIAQSQLQKEEELLPKANQFLFCDTELIVTKVWSEHSYKGCDEWILQNINKHLYDLYLLCDVDLPWEYDPQREHPELREYFFSVYLKELKSRNFPFTIISGKKDIRLRKAIGSIEKKLLKTI